MKRLAICPILASLPFTTNPPASPASLDKPITALALSSTLERFSSLVSKISFKDSISFSLLP